MTAILDRPTTAQEARAETNRIFLEAPHGPDWLARFVAAIRAERATEADWIVSRCPDSEGNYWAVRS